MKSIRVIAIASLLLALVIAFAPAASASTASYPPEPYFHHPELVASALEKTLSNYTDGTFSYGQLRCVGARDAITCTSSGSYSVQAITSARVEWQLTLSDQSADAFLDETWYATDSTTGYRAGDMIYFTGGPFASVSFGLADWATGEPEHPTDGAWIPDWAKGFRQPSKVAQAMQAAVNNPLTPASPGRNPARPYIKQGRASCSAAPRLILCSAAGLMRRAEGGKPVVPVTIRWRLTKASSRFALLEIGFYSNSDAPYDSATDTGPWKKGEYMGHLNLGQYYDGAYLPSAAFRLKQW